MTLSATTNKIAYPGPGGTVFMANFPAVQASDVEVYKTDQTTGLVVGSALVNVTDYTLTGLGGTGFTVTLTADGLLLRSAQQWNRLKAASGSLWNSGRAAWPTLASSCSARPSSWQRRGRGKWP